MKKIVSSIVVATLCVVAFGEPSSPNISKTQSELRGHYTRTFRQYNTMFPKLASQFSVQTKSGNEDFRFQEFEDAAAKIRQIEGNIVIQESSVGTSRVWNSRVRSGNCEMRPDAQHYLTGAENEIIIHNGELVQNVTDMIFPTRGGLGFSFRRIYLSNTAYSGPLGNGWDFNYNARLILNNADIALATRASLYVGGVEYKFFKQKGSWNSEPGNYFYLAQEDSAFYIYDSQMFRMEFEAAIENKSAYRLKALASKHGNYLKNRIVFEYQVKSDRLSQITEPYGNKTFIIYNQDGRICQVASKAQSIFYTYDPCGNLATVHTAPVATSLNSHNTMRVCYGYVSFGGRYLLNSRTENNSNSKYLVEYDAKGRVTSAGKISGDADARWKITYSDTTTTVTPAKPAAQIIYEFTGKSKDLPSSISVPALNAKTLLEYSASGKVIKSTDALGIVNLFSYDETASSPNLRNNLLRVVTIPCSSQAPKIVQKISYIPQTAFRKKVQVFEYDTNNTELLLSTQSYKYSADWEIAETNENGIITRYFYNQFGQLALTMDANNRATINYYADQWTGENKYSSSNKASVNGAGLLIKTVEDASRLDLDNASAELKIPRFIFNDISRIQPVSLPSRFTYDAQGNLICFQKGNTISLTLYNRAGKIIASYTSGLGVTVTRYTNDFKKHSILHQFTPNSITSFSGERHESFSGNFYRESFSYDSLGFISTHTKTNEPIGGKVPTFIYQRYSSGIIKQITNPDGITRVDEYGENGLLYRQLLCGQKESVIISSDFEYFSNGSVKSYKNAQGDKTDYELDIYGRPSVTKQANGNIITTQLDGLGRVVATETKNNGQVIARQENIYDLNGMISAKYDYVISERENKKVEAQRFIYDAAGNTIARKNAHKDGWVIYLLDGLNRKVASAMPGGDISIEIYSADKLVMPVQLNLISGKKYKVQGVIHLLNTASQPCATLQVSSDWNTEIERSRFFRYSADGLVISTLNPKQTENCKYYNTLGLLVREETIPQQKSYGEKNIVVDYEYSCGGLIKKKTLHNMALVISGNKDDVQAELISAPQCTIYCYDQLGRQSSIQQPDGLIVEKVYDAHSMPVGMIWRHATQPEKILRHLKLKYGQMGHLISITDAVTKRIQRHYTYDVYGNCIVAKDLSSAPEISTVRKFNSVGQLISENTYWGTKSLPGYSITKDVVNGQEILQY